MVDSEPKIKLLCNANREIVPIIYSNGNIFIRFYHFLLNFSGTKVEGAGKRAIAIDPDICDLLTMYVFDRMTAGFKEQEFDNSLAEAGHLHIDLIGMLKCAVLLYAVTCDNKPADNKHFTDFMQNGDLPIKHFIDMERAFCRVIMDNENFDPPIEYMEDCLYVEERIQDLDSLHLLTLSSLLHRAYNIIQSTRKTVAVAGQDEKKKNKEKKKRDKKKKKKMVQNEVGSTLDPEAVSFEPLADLSSVPLAN